MDLDHIEQDTNPIYYDNQIVNILRTRLSIISLDYTNIYKIKPVPLRVIFLDVDGVLNTYNQALAQQINHTCLKNFCELVTRTNAYIVISSSWRKYKTFMYKLMSSLRLFNCEYRVIGKTIEISPFDRPDEIMDWIYNFEERYATKIDSWIAVDDMRLEQMSKDMCEKCILTDSRYGFIKCMIPYGEELLKKQEIL